MGRRRIRMTPRERYEEEMYENLFRDKLGDGDIFRSKQHRNILCVNTGEVFATYSAAAREYGLDQSNVCKCCKGHLTQTWGYKFEYTSYRVTKE